MHLRSKQDVYEDFISLDKAKRIPAAKTLASMEHKSLEEWLLEQLDKKNVFAVMTIRDIRLNSLEAIPKLISFLDMDYPVMYSKKTFLRIIEKSTPPFNEVSLEALKSIVEVDFKYDKRKWAEWYKNSEEKLFWSETDKKFKLENNEE